MHIMMFEFLKKLDDGKKCYKPDFIPHRLCKMRSQKLWAKCYKNGLKCTHSFIKGFNCDTILQSLRLSKSLHTFNFFNNSPPGFQYNPWILQCCLLRQKFITNLWNVVQTWWGFSVFFVPVFKLARRQNHNETWDASAVADDDDLKERQWERESSNLYDFSFWIISNKILNFTARLAQTWVTHPHKRTWKGKKSSNDAYGKSRALSLLYNNVRWIRNQWS